ncbi:hypothetical protein HOC_16012 [Hyphomonas oceanitis SCH89]|uniref:Phytase-like domain-containing protein n=2 Tax=Hyphomonas oceanitis TaxID=81033 RepID=A0A059G3M3_9PROT|nr:hypothetical protein HOC_16012 [Hyphomonas oceanitis SCH89]
MAFQMKKTCLIALLLMSIGACAAPEIAETAATKPSPATALWSFESASRNLREESCPAGTRFGAPLSLDITATPVSLNDEDANPPLPDVATFAGGWSLTSDNTNFGGLSGLETLPDGKLLSISDVGAFVWLGMTDGHPDGTGELAYMLGQDGGQLSGKAEGDSEGLAYRDGLAIVSFERNHRLEAFDLENCGAAARAALVAKLPAEANGKPIDENQGAEALSISRDGILTYGLESLFGGPSPMGEVFANGTSKLTGEDAANPRGYSFVGRDEVPVSSKSPIIITLYRSYDPIRGNRNIITWSTSDERIELKRPMLVDNFEGVAGEIGAEGRLRIWMISDNNFSGKQQTLLYAFDVDISSE